MKQTVAVKRRDFQPVFFAGVGGWGGVFFRSASSGVVGTGAPTPGEGGP